ncbi:MAG TPA: ParA family protein [Myxococcota bacterium]|nr:ParA family protein [Myxococcota bacterium]
MSRFFDAIRRADESRQLAVSLAPVPSGPGRTLAVVSNKGGVGKTTVATNLAVYLRAMREDLPVLVIGLDDQSTIDRMFEIGTRSGATIADALRAGSLAGAIRLGHYGVHYVPTSARIGELKRELQDPDRLRRTIASSGWRGVVIVDTKSDLEVLTQNALRASDLALVLARDLGSVTEAGKVFELLQLWGRPGNAARILLSQVDLRVKYASGEARDILALLLAEIRRLEYPLLGSFVSSSPKVEALLSNPDRVVRSVLHGAPTSLVHRQLRHLAEELLEILRPDAVDSAEPAAAAPGPAPADPAPAREPDAPRRPLAVDVSAWLGLPPVPQVGAESI